MSSHASDRARVIPLRPGTATAVPGAEAAKPPTPATAPPAPATPAQPPGAKEPLWRHVVGGVLRRERLAQQRTLKDVAGSARISMPYLSEVERGRKEPSSEVLAAAAHALGFGLSDVLRLVQGELARLASPARRGGPGGGPAPAPPASPFPAASPGGARPASSAAAERDDGEAGRSVSELSTPQTGTRPAAPRQGEVRLAA